MLFFRIRLAEKLDTTHGRLPYIEYVVVKDVDTVAREVVDGKWGNGAERKRRLEAAGYDYAEVQKRVSRIMKTIPIAESLAQEVLEGKWGNGNVRKERLELVGYDYRIVQDKVNEIVSRR